MKKNAVKYLFPALSIIILAFFLHGRIEGASNIADAKLFDRAVTAIERNYVDPDRIDVRKMFDGALSRIQETVPEILVKGPDGDGFQVVVGLAIKKFKYEPMSAAGDLKRAMKDVLSFIAANYHGDTKPEEIEYAAIDGMLDVLDPHSNFMSPKIYNEFKVGTRGEFGGLGIVISLKEGRLTVIAPIEGTPASRAGIRAGDRILQIDDESTINMSLTDAVNRLRGEVNSKVTIIVERPGSPARKITLTRALINIDSVQQTTFSANGKRIGYLKVKSFQANTDEAVVNALNLFHKDGAKLDGLILDLRNNPGGLLNIAVDVADHFLKDGVIVSTVGPRDEVIEKDVARAQGAKETAPMIVLVNEGSASASEIVAGALKANNRAVVMGRRSFGKGTVQTIFELGDDTALKLTIAQYKPAGTETIQLAGVVPDVELMPSTVDKKAMNLVEDVLPSEEDLEKHLESGKAFKVEGEEPPAYRVHYLKPAEDEKDLEALSAREYAKTPDVQNDFAVKLARGLLSKVGNPERKTFISEIKGPLPEAEAEEDRVIAAALAKMGIVWSIAKPAGEPKLKLAYHLRGKGVDITRAKAGQKIEVVLSATNVGTGPYSRLIASGQSDLPFLANKEFVFGRLEPGAARAQGVEIELPEGLATQELVMDIVFEEANRKLPAPTDIKIPVDELPKPQFSFGYSIPTPPAGRRFAPGATIPVTFDIANTGTGATSLETAATISNECAEKLFIEQGRVKLGVILPKQSRRAAFKFHMASNADPADCKLKLSIADLKQLVVLTKKFDVIADAGKLKPPAGVKYAPPVITVDKPPQSTKEAEIKISGKITDTDRVRDYYIFVGDKKIAYTPNPEDTMTMTFSETAPLEPGTNYIWVAARDEMDLSSSKTIVVERTSGEKKKAKVPRGRMVGPDM